MIESCLPFGLIVLEDLPLGVIADVLDVDEAAQVELLRSKLRHDEELGKEVDN